MKRIILSTVLALVVLAAGMQAQEGPSTARIEKQHRKAGALEKMEKSLPTMEVNLLKSLDNENPNVQAQAAQTMRDLLEMFPTYSFASWLEPVGKKLKDEKTDAIVRRLLALALDQLHSDAGDAVIASVASSSEDKGLGLLCKALLVRSQYNK